MRESRYAPCGCFRCAPRVGFAASTVTASENNATTTLLLVVPTQQTLPGGGFEDVVDALARQRRALEVLFRADAFAHVLALVGREEFLRPLAHLLLRHGVVAQVLFEPDQDDGHAGAALEDFGMPVWRDRVLVS